MAQRNGVGRRALICLSVLAALAYGVAGDGGDAREARAYTFYMTNDGAFPLRWWQRPDMFFTLSTVAPEEASAAAVQGYVETAFDQWIGAPCGRVPEVVFKGTNDAQRATTPSSLRTKQDNVIVFIRSAAEWARFKNSPTWIAITKIAHDPSSGEIVDADIEINDGGYRFSYDDSPGRDEVDFLSMLTHELGHFYGLDHATDASATMFATYATSPEDAMEARSLSQDDLDGICALYTDVPVHVPFSNGDGDCRGGGLGTWAWAGLGAVVLAARRRTRSSGRAARARS